LSPLDSALILSPKNGVYKLYARDIAEVPLRAELVTISACKSAGARTYSGEGQVGLAWAFLQAGASNVIAGLWDVDDTYTPGLMDSLYAGMQKGMDAAEALRRAKLALIHSQTVARKPYYWGPFLIFTGRDR
jgi:CHAT domain-containing protein